MEDLFYDMTIWPLSHGSAFWFDFSGCCLSGSHRLAHYITEKIYKMTAANSDPLYSVCYHDRMTNSNDVKRADPLDPNPPSHAKRLSISSVIARIDFDSIAVIPVQVMVDVGVAVEGGVRVGRQLQRHIKRGKTHTEARH